MDNQRNMQFDIIKQRVHGQVDNSTMNSQLRLLQEQLNQLPQLSVLSTPAVIQYKLIHFLPNGTLLFVLMVIT